MTTRAISATLIAIGLAHKSSLAARITVIPDLCNGRPTVRGLRITVATGLGYLAARETVYEVLRHHPMLERDDVFACLEFASELMN